MALEWLRCSVEPLDSGARAAKFPYSRRYAVIETEADCLGTIEDETHQWDEAFRSSLSVDLCKFIALLNSDHRFETTHTVIGSHDPKKIPGYEWAKASLGVAVTVMFRETPARFEIDDHARLVRWFCHVFSAPSFAGDSTGWLLGVRPEVVLYEDTDGGSDIRGYAVELRAAAFANSEGRCSERLSRMLTWLSELLSGTTAGDQRGP
jgi:hypothetical protein